MTPYLGDQARVRRESWNFKRKRDLGPLPFTIWTVAIVAALVLCALIGR